jgi:hypothetical protein
MNPFLIYEQNLIRLNLNRLLWRLKNLILCPLFFDGICFVENMWMKICPKSLRPKWRFIKWTPGTAMPELSQPVLKTKLCKFFFAILDYFS